MTVVVLVVLHMVVLRAMVLGGERRAVVVHLG